MKLYNEIPSLDLNDFTSGDPEKKAAFVKALGDAYNEIGFVAIKNHGLTEEMTHKLYFNVKAFFGLREDLKQKYEKPELQGQRGYIGKGKEHAKGRTTGDLKEFFHIGQEKKEGDEVTAEYPHNIWPAELPDFQNVGNKVFRTLEETGLHMLRAIAIYLGLDENFFDDKASKGNSILRPIHYYPIPNPEEVPDDAVRAAEHGDINLITLLMGASADGLQVLRRDGEWIPITALPDQIVVNVGDMLDRLTNHKLKSTIHRVVNPPKDKMNSSRYSIPFFMHPRSDMDLTCLESCVDEENPKKYSDMTAGEFLAERLAEIGFGKK
ncbi:isopenicillin N synthase family dioxygenase [Chondrinema litorale]|uniref:isopenicillin N synthase family dioxygenase n=1 Tax=Chondrinema litorale TaxID=2994555 RepID=UPI002543236C|nr:2-oxoglutarate and iron-dependent oxygenase domain-containing protein [Chondrinema litorale]UZR95136.1 isopenicillin N synthase family oxygenase [Chondrinema litorale]